MIRVALSREPVEVPLVGAFTGVVLTIRRLTAPDFSRAQGHVQSLLRDKGALATILLRNQLVETAADLERAQNDLAFQTGFAVWLSSVECALVGIKAWTGVTLDDGAPAPLARDLSKVAGIADPPDPADLAARLTLETLMLDQGFQAQVEAALNRSSRLLAIEGNGSGLSANGSAVAPLKTPGGPPGAATARKPRKAAPKAAATR